MIREAQESDLNFISELEKLCFSMPRKSNQIKLCDDMHILLVSDDQSGYAGLTFIEDEGYIDNIAVVPEKRRLGIGDKMLEALLIRAWDLKLSFVSLEVRAGNTSAISLYKKHSFIIEGKMKDYYFAPKDDAIIMTVRRPF